jgi:hypothetical protein
MTAAPLHSPTIRANAMALDIEIRDQPIGAAWRFVAGDTRP